MAGYDYKSGGYNTYGSTEPPTYAWRKPGYDGDRYSDRTERGRPMVADADGRRRSTLPFAAPSVYVTKTETVVEKIETRAPPTFEYKHGIPRADPVRAHGDGFKLSSSPSYDHRPPQVEEFITKIQTDVAPPVRTGPNTYWDGDRDRDLGYGNRGYHHNTNGYGHNGRKNNDRGERDRVKGDRDRDGYYDGYRRTSGSPTRHNSGSPNYRNRHMGDRDRDDCYDGHRRTSGSPTKHGSSSPSHGNRLSEATTDIEKAVEYLKEAAAVVKPPSNVTTTSRPKFRVSVPVVPRNY